MTSHSRLLIGLVISMGVLIVIGTTYLGVTVYKRFGHGKAETQVTMTPNSKETSDKAVFQSVLKLGAEDRITKMTQGKDGLSLFVRTRPNGERIIFIDPQTGGTRGVLSIEHKD